MACLVCLTSNAYDNLLNVVEVSLRGHKRPRSNDSDSDTEDIQESKMIEFWYLNEWKLSQSFERAISKNNDETDQTGNVGMRYVEDKDGVPVSKAYTSVIQQQAYAIWTDWAKQGDAPPNWGSVSAAGKHKFKKVMLKEFPELRLCAFNWKLDKLATLYYPSWIQSKCETIQCYKNEVSKREMSSIPILQPQQDDEGLHSKAKQRKVAEVPGTDTQKSMATMTTVPKNDTVGGSAPLTPVITSVQAPSLHSPDYDWDHDIDLELYGST
ncbi:uncharacterized protein ARMOST_20835 [Armillaria ostoyae]|uniref:Uncharacterized protein n=1 Tax=Armillaria ostoyae TaxID=47428 RepID=A0A284S8H1_ARMOS|nr:uncharacterized protein ARMOST_20835 [Armillaria ostoyae]